MNAQTEASHQCKCKIVQLTEQKGVIITSVSQDVKSRRCNDPAPVAPWCKCMMMVYTKSKLINIQVFLYFACGWNLFTFLESCFGSRVKIVFRCEHHIIIIHAPFHVHCNSITITDYTRGYFSYWVLRVKDGKGVRCVALQRLQTSWHTSTRLLPFVPYFIGENFGRGAIEKEKIQVVSSGMVCPETKNSQGTVI